MADSSTGPTDLVGLGKIGAQLIETGERFLTRLFGPLLDEKGRQWAEASRHRHDNMLKVAGMASRIVGDKEMQPVPGRVLFPLLNYAGNEDDEELQKKWAALLANATMDSHQVPPSYPSILSSLSPVDALVLDWVHLQDKPSVPMEEFLLGHAELKKSFLATMDNLWRLGLIRPTLMPLTINTRVDPNSVVLPSPGPPTYNYVGLTELGESFVTACYPPNEAYTRRRLAAT